MPSAWLRCPSDDTKLEHFAFVKPIKIAPVDVRVRAQPVFAMRVPDAARLGARVL